MSRLTVYHDLAPDQPILRTEQPERMADALSAIGVRFRALGQPGRPVAGGRRRDHPGGRIALISTG